ncbi:18990_t:CDS:2, partial [Racocetra persica]
FENTVNPSNLDGNNECLMKTSGEYFQEQTGDFSNNYMQSVEQETSFVYFNDNEFLE